MPCNTWLAENKHHNINPFCLCWQATQPCLGKWRMWRWYHHHHHHHHHRQSQQLWWHKLLATAPPVIAAHKPTTTTTATRTRTANEVIIAINNGVDKPSKGCCVLWPLHCYCVWWWSLSLRGGWVKISSRTMAMGAAAVARKFGRTLTTTSIVTNNHLWLFFFIFDLFFRFGSSGSHNSTIITTTIIVVYTVPGRIL